MFWVVSRDREGGRVRGRNPLLPRSPHLEKLGLAVMAVQQTAVLIPRCQPAPQLSEPELGGDGGEEEGGERGGGRQQPAVGDGVAVHRVLGRAGRQAG